MEKKTLFEIPIYSMSKKEFNRRWDKQKQKLHDTYVSHGHSEEDTQYYVSRFSFPRSLWEYNQIIGYIKISVSRHDVWFDIYCSLDKIYYADSKQKHFIQNIQANGTHFYSSKPDNKMIKEEIFKWLKAIEKDHLKKSFYVDYTAFNNIIEYVDIEQIMKTL